MYYVKIAYTVQTLGKGYEKKSFYVLRAKQMFPLEGEEEGEEEGEGEGEG